MFVLDGAKARVVALVLIFATAVPLIPQSHAAEKPKATAAEPKAVKKRKHHKRPPKAPVKEVERKKDPIEIVLATAHKQLGKPYRWGARGPSSFDCSGFTSYVWNKAGVTIPRTSSQQRAWAKGVKKKHARPGDLVFSSGHVGLYLGKGRMIHSPHSGRHVEIAPIHPGTYGFGRVRAKS
jgi:cell wall-associated NlpC family hydrolase